MANFIHMVFTNSAMEEDFGAKLINREVFTSGAATAASTSLAIQNSKWVDASIGRVEAKSGYGIYSRPLIALKFNTDLREHNYEVDRNPDIQDSGSVAFLISRKTTLGGTIMELNECNIEEVKFTDCSTTRTAYTGETARNIQTNVQPSQWSEHNS